MAYKHGVYTGEIPTSIVAPANTTAGLPVIFGIAPVHLATNPAKANTPVLCYTYAEAVQQLGYSDDWEKYTLCEAIYCQFALYNVAPVVFINVLDEAVHKQAVADSEVTLDNRKAMVAEPVILDTLVVKKSSAGEALKAGIDYEAAYNDDGILVITALDDGELETASTVYLSYDKLTPESIDADDIIGGVSISTGKATGLEVLNNVFTKTRLVPGLVAAPGFSDNSEVQAVMKAKAGNINGLFQALAVCDLPADDTLKNYTDVPSYKDSKGYTGVNQVALWPMVKLGSKKFHLSTAFIGICGQADAANNDIPYRSPSNMDLQADGLCLEDGTEVELGLEQANYLNGQGVVTGLNFYGGWKLWGNRTACYPGNTDPKDAFIYARRMFNWHAQTFILTYWQQVDSPVNRRFIERILDSENIRLNGLVAIGALLGGRIEFVEDDNPATSLIDGIITFHTYITPPVPARDMENNIEFDVDYLSALFG